MQCLKLCSPPKKTWTKRGGGGCQLVSVLAFTSIDSSSNPAKAYSLCKNCVWKERKLTKIKPGVWDTLAPLFLIVHNRKDPVNFNVHKQFLIDFIYWFKVFDG